MGEPQSSFYTFITEPMVNLEPGIAEGHDLDPASSNIELEQNMAQNLGPAYGNTQHPKETAAKDKKDARPRKTAERTKLSLYQKLELKNVFQHTPYPTRAVRAQLAYSLGLGHKTVVNWFKKRRYHWRRQSVNPGQPVAFPCHLPQSQAQVFGQYQTPQDTCHCCFQQPSAARRQKSH
ncbi:hypothetical protein ACROYT_G043499 [Oculina patagonica]